MSRALYKRGRPTREQIRATGRPLEKVVQRQIMDLFLVHGAKVCTTSQYRASHVTEGMPDLYCIHRKAGGWWFEVKRPRKLASFDRFRPETWEPEPLSPAQQEFRDLCLAAGVAHFWGGYREAKAALVTLGISRVVNPS